MMIKVIVTHMYIPYGSQVVYSSLQINRFRVFTVRSLPGVWSFLSR